MTNPTKWKYLKTLRNGKILLWWIIWTCSKLEIRRKKIYYGISTFIKIFTKFNLMISYSFSWYIIIWSINHYNKCRQHKKCPFSDKNKLVIQKRWFMKCYDVCRVCPWMSLKRFCDIKYDKLRCVKSFNWFCIMEKT